MGAEKVGCLLLMPDMTNGVFWHLAVPEEQPHTTATMTGGERRSGKREGGGDFGR